MKTPQCVGHGASIEIVLDEDLVSESDHSGAPLTVIWAVAVVVDLHDIFCSFVVVDHDWHLHSATSLSVALME